MVVGVVLRVERPRLALAVLVARVRARARIRDRRVGMGDPRAAGAM